MAVSFLINISYTMKLFVCMLLVTMVVTAMLIDDSEAGAPRRRSSRRRYVDGQAAVMEVVEEARELLDDLADLQEDAKAEQMMELEDLGQEEDDTQKLSVIIVGWCSEPGNIGGMMGLFIGASLLTILEVWEYLWQRPKGFLRRNHRPPVDADKATAAYDLEKGTAFNNTAFNK
uniref:Uncharacterized protein n=1 Tax=Branchiostoma floridae TaxID=7739 RepID=C3ZYE8_BRAFL|eukprot:XP_002586411.1 hypothetical protein BRAFLDRAFT_131804 [Branchiostoma floridae]